MNSFVDVFLGSEQAQPAMSRCSDAENGGLVYDFLPYSMLLK